MVFIGRSALAADTQTGIGSGHVGYIAGRYRSGVWSDHWTEVSRCAGHTFTQYAPACACGWRGPRPTCYGNPDTAPVPDPTAATRRRSCPATGDHQSPLVSGMCSILEPRRAST